MARVTSDEAPVREILTYELFGTAVRELAQQVVDDGYEPDIVLAIARGGLGLAMGIGYALDVKNLSAVNVEFYTGVDAAPRRTDHAAADAGRDRPDRA